MLDFVISLFSARLANNVMTHEIGIYQMHAGCLVKNDSLRPWTLYKWPVMRAANMEGGSDMLVKYRFCFPVTIPLLSSLLTHENSQKHWIIWVPS